MNKAQDLNYSETFTISEEQFVHFSRFIGSDRLADSLEICYIGFPIFHVERVLHEGEFTLEIYHMEKPVQNDGPVCQMGSCRTEREDFPMLPEQIITNLQEFPQYVRDLALGKQEVLELKVRGTIT